ncbi:MAG TPA: S-layer homology domain-containing protein [Chloroflexia bacterium]|nr:S-layer homology domain-containing protein [Chloroflexia bacterium]
MTDSTICLSARLRAFFLVALFSFLLLLPVSFGTWRDAQAHTLPLPSDANTRSTGGCGGPWDIAVVYSDDDVSPQLMAQIAADPDSGLVVAINARFSTPTLQQLLPYDEVVVYSNTEYDDPVALGNVIADYQDAGGVVVATNANWWGPPYGMEGRWMTGGYTMFNSPAPSNNSTSNLGVYTATHPLMQGVDQLTAFFRTQATLTAGSSQEALWADGWPLVAHKTTNGNTAVGLNAYLGFPEEGWSGDWGTLIVNAARWLKGVPCQTSTPGVTSTATPTGIPPATATATSTPVAPSPTPTACTLEFADVPPTNTFYPFVRCLACQGIISGYPCGGTGEPCNPNDDPYFRPNAYVTRGQLAKIVSESAGFDEKVPPSTWTFTDVPYGSTFWVWVERLADREVMAGYVCGIDPNEPCDGQNRPYFRPSSGATRGQLTKIVSNAAGFDDTIPPTTQTFEDIPPTHTFWLFVERLLLNRPDVMSGYPCGGPNEPCVPPGNRPYFRPGNPLTRGQTSKIVANTFFPGCDPPLRR